MKLYFYFLENGAIRTEACEAEKDYKSYFLDKKVNGYFGIFETMVLERDIGILHPGWSDIVILTEPDTEKARQVYSGWIDQTIAMKEKEIENKQKEIAELEKKLEIVQSFKDPWRE